ncbi:hypothetical protein HvAV-3i_gp122 [Heliothis virescens ascovirus 3i]|nr:hypothetical protein HvAV-3i_gp122 [Heliothis virescens ascovirus 3i]
MFNKWARKKQTSSSQQRPNDLLYPLSYGAVDETVVLKSVESLKYADIPVWEQGVEDEPTSETNDTLNRDVISNQPRVVGVTYKQTTTSRSPSKCSPYSSESSYHPAESTDTDGSSSACYVVNEEEDEEDRESSASASVDDLTCTNENIERSATNTDLKHICTDIVNVFNEKELAIVIDERSRSSSFAESDYGSQEQSETTNLEQCGNENSASNEHCDGGSADKGSAEDNVTVSVSLSIGGLAFRRLIAAVGGIVIALGVLLKRQIQYR